MPHPVDVAVGARVRELRIRAGLNQSQLGKRLGLSFQQIQKYESGVNRMGASRLIQISEALSCPLSALFDGIEEQDSRPTAEILDGPASKVARDWQRIDDTEVREVLRTVVKSFVGSANDDA